MSIKETLERGWAVVAETRWADLVRPERIAFYQAQMPDVKVEHWDKIDGQEYIAVLRDGKRLVERIEP